MALFGGLPMGIMTDSYKAGHFTQYPEAIRASAYGEFRRGYNKDKEDTRVVFYGVRYIVETFLHRKCVKRASHTHTHTHLTFTPHALTHARTRERVGQNKKKKVPPLPPPV